jgi:hypothetical protein
MNKTRVTLLLLIAVVAGGNSIRAQSPPASTTVVLRGTIQKYDPPSKVLAVSTSSGTQKFVMTSDVRIRERWHRVDASALENLVGHRVAVRYSESNDVKTVESVRVFGKDGSQ